MEYEPTKRAMRRERRSKQARLTAIQCLCMAVMACLGGLVLPDSWHFGRSEPEPEFSDEDLRLVRRTVSDDHNGFFILAKERPVYWPRETQDANEAYRLISGTSSNWELAREILERNYDVLRLFDASMGRRDFQYPDFQDPVHWVELTTNWWRLTHLISLDALYRAEQEGARAGFAKAMEILRFGQRVQRAQGSLIQWVMGSHFKRQGLLCIRLLLLRPDVRSQQLAGLSREMERFGADREGFIFTVKFEYRFALGQLERVARKELDLSDLLLTDEPDEGRGAFDLEGTRRQLADVSRSVIRCTEEERGWGLQGAPEGSAGTGQRDKYIDQAADGWRLGLQEGAMEDTALVATRTLLALKAHKQDTGEMARTLGDLVPAYMPEVPVDPFDGRSLRYSPSEGIVYSVGTDLEDQGGTPASGRHEPTFRIGF